VGEMKWGGQTAASLQKRAWRSRVGKGKIKEDPPRGLKRDRVHEKGPGRGKGGGRGGGLRRLNNGRITGKPWREGINGGKIPNSQEGWLKGQEDRRGGVERDWIAGTLWEYLTPLERPFCRSKKTSSRFQRGIEVTYSTRRNHLKGGNYSGDALTKHEKEKKKKKNQFNNVAASPTKICRGGHAGAAPAVVLTPIQGAHLHPNLYGWGQLGRGPGGAEDRLGQGKRVKRGKKKGG